MYIRTDLFLYLSLYIERERDNIRCTINHMGWLRLVGSLKMYVSFAEYSLFHWALLQKSPMILGSLLIVATPYQHSRDRDNIQCTMNDMGWLRLVGSLKTYVSFAKEPYKRDYILQERPIFLRSLPNIATPYQHSSDRERIRCTINDMGWLRLVGSLKMHVSFAEHSLFYRALLQKCPMF